MTRKCSECLQEKDASCFRQAKNNNGSYKSAKCKDCLNAQGARYYQANKEKWREREKRRREEDYEGFLRRSREAQARHRANPDNKIHLRYLKARYGVDEAWYAKTLDDQGGGCAVCGEKAPLNKRLHVDHDHTTGQVRGLLCFRHNVALGAVKDSVTELEWLGGYLRKHGKVN